MPATRAIRVGLVGCGAVAELYHAPALQSLVAAGQVTVAGVMDPAPSRRTLLASLLPGAKPCENLEGLAAQGIELAVIASPVRWHHDQAIALMERGCHILCEKPLAASVAQAEAMVATARARRVVLAAGMVRRFYPALRQLRHAIHSGVFGPLRSYEIQEGGPFNWPAATASFFDRKFAGGGVLIDAGVHVLDVLHWFLGDPSEVRYADDAEGGLEATCRLELRHPGSALPVRGTVLLSRDSRTANAWRFEFATATLLWRVGAAHRLELRLAGSDEWLSADIETEVRGERAPADTYTQAFTRQIADVVASITAPRPPFVPGEAAVFSLRTIEQCYRDRTALYPENLR